MFTFCFCRLAVVNAVRMTKTVVEEGCFLGSDREDIHSDLVMDAQLHSLESYINPDVYTALRLHRRHADMLRTASDSPLLYVPPEDDNEQTTDDVLGVALLQPVTTGIEFGKVFRSRFPSKRFLCINIEPISTMLSFEDLQLIESVLKRWSSERSELGESDPRDGREGHVLERSTPQEWSCCESDSHSPGVNVVGSTHASEKPNISYEVIFHSSRLGLGLKKVGDDVVVDKVGEAQYGDIQVGDILVLIGGRKLWSTALPTVVQQLAKESRPMKVTFMRPNPSSAIHNGTAKYCDKTQNAGLVQSSYEETLESRTSLTDTGRSEKAVFTLQLKPRSPHGFLLEKSSVGDVPVVTRVEPSITKAAIIEETQASVPARFPRTGALIIQLDGIECSELGFSDSVKLISEHCSRYSRSNGNLTVTFLEFDAAVLGDHDKFDVSVSGAVLTFIDDLNGRDMPLLRGNLKAVELHVERGICIKTSLLDTAKQKSCILQPESDEESMAADGAVTLAAIARMTVEYFHPRISVYEPLLEPAQLCVLFERRNPNLRTRRPGEFAIEISDCLLRTPPFENGFGAELKPQLLCLNLSDASSEVIAKALKEWETWRKNVETHNAEGSALEDPLNVEKFSSVTLHSSTRSSAFDYSSVLDSEPSKLGVVVGLGDIEEDDGESPKAKHVAARNAAHAALLFAQKRGADKGGKSESSTPFVLRNRTGVSIAFVQQKLEENAETFRRIKKSQSRLSLVGEYKGLEQYDRGDVTELADQEDAKFHMDIQNSGHSSPFHDTAKRVRSYDGKFPFLTVAIQAIAGVYVEPIPDLPVYKAGSTIRQLLVHKETDTGRFRSESSTGSRYSVPVVWKVEVEDNRRILTLSSAVRIVSLGSTSSIEVGVRKSAMLSPGGRCRAPGLLSTPFSGSTSREDEGSGAKGAAMKNANVLLASGAYEDPMSKLPGENSSEKVDSSAIQAIGLAHPESPFYLPLWLALKLELVRVYIRPRISGMPLYSWGTESVLEFSPSHAGSLGSSGTDWIWQETFDETLGSIKCNSLQEGGAAAFLSCYATGVKSDEREGGIQDFITEGVLAAEQLSEVLSVSIDSGLTLRNMLPVDIEWEAAHGFGQGIPQSVDGSVIRNRSVYSSSLDAAFSTSHAALRSGERADVYACNFKVETLKARFRLRNEESWSTWASVSSPVLENKDGGDSPKNGKAQGQKLPLVRQINVQLEDAFGVPITFGVRVMPKVAKLSTRQSDTVCCGVDVVVYAELWIGNLTSLPLTFGCPAIQIYAKHDSGGGESLDTTENVATKFSAEAALMEIASVLELGDKGTGFDTRNADLAASAGEIYILPHQESCSIAEEIFEFIETEDSTVKRRWWASESYWSLRNSNILHLKDDGHSWHWLDDAWKIDCTGQASASSGGWESTKTLLGEPFSGRREFFPSHPFRRRRWSRIRATNGFGGNLEGVPCHAQGLAVHGTTLLPGLQAFHHPIVDSFTKAQRRAERKQKKKGLNESQKTSDGVVDSGIRSKKDSEDDFAAKIAIKCGDGRWSVPVTVSPRGSCHGIVKVFASRWLALTKSFNNKAGDNRVASDGALSTRYAPAPLSPALYELIYYVSEVDAEWGELSRLMLVSARFSVRNDSAKIAMEVKQAGARDESALKLSPGEIAPFYWSDFRLPELVCVRPAARTEDGRSVYKWSGGFDVCRLGMAALLVRQSLAGQSQRADAIRSIRSLVEIRPGTGGFGINLSFKEESPDGEGALFRIENRSTFNIWLSQDGVLANPSAAAPHDFSGSDGDLIRPGSQISFGLDVPYRQGKYAGRQAATMAELLRVRVGLAPLSSRAGIETTKVIGLTVVGDCVRLKPTKLITVLDADKRKALERVRVLAVTTADGPSRVLKFW
jgi:hypothetical protein